MAVGLLGGSFNPAHDGHLAISLHALARLGLDRVWWLVSPGNPLKDKAGLKPLKTRLCQARTMARSPKIDVTGFEAGLPDAYTRHTLEHLQGRFPATRFVWLMGADNLAGFQHWVDWRGIFHAVPIAVLDRPGYRFKALAGPAARSFAHARIDEGDAAGFAGLQPPVWTFLTLPLSPQSSTAIRQTTRG